MFTELVPLLKQRPIMVSLALIGDNLLRATVTPLGKKDGPSQDDILTKPLSVTGSPEEMDATFATEIQRFVSSVLQTGSNLEQLQTAQKTALASLDAEHKKQLAERKRIHSGGKTASPAAPVKDPETAEAEEEEPADPAASAASAATAPVPPPEPPRAATDGLPLFAAPATAGAPRTA